MNIKSEKSIKEYLKTIPDETIIKYYLHVEFSPFPVLVIDEYTRRFKKKNKQEILEKLKYQARLARSKAKNLKTAANQGKIFDDITKQKSEEMISQAKKKGFEISENLFEKTGIVGSKLKTSAKSTIKNRLKKGQFPSTSSKENLELLQKLGELKKAGIITASEFQEKKKKILEKI